MSDAQDTPLPDLKYIRELAKVFKQYQLGEIEIETGEQRILLRRGGGGAVVAQPEAIAAPVAAAPAPVAPAPAPAPAAPAPAEDEGDYITSPFVGTFYTAPRPDAEAFVAIGQTVAAGQTVCIVEAMKLFNEIDADFPCVIEEMLVDNAQPVEFGTKLYRVKRL